MALLWGGTNDGGRVENPAARVMRRALMRAGGAAALVLAVALGLALASFDISDPSFFSATPKPPSNWLGPLGASVAAPVMQALGLGSWAVVAVLGVWGWRFAFGLGEHRIWARILAVPVLVVLASLFASLHVPWQGWQLSSGLGGMIGDRAGGMAVTFVPLDPRPALLWLTLGAGLTTLVTAGFALGLSGAEARRLSGWLFRSFGMVLQRVLRLTGSVLRSLAGMARASRARGEELESQPRSKRLEPAEPTGSWRRRTPLIQTSEPNEPVLDEPDAEADTESEPRRRFGLSSLLGRRARAEIPAERLPGAEGEDENGPAGPSVFRRKEPEVTRPRVPAAPIPEGPAEDDLSLAAAIRSLRDVGIESAAEGEVGSYDEDDEFGSSPTGGGPRASIAGQRPTRKSRRAQREAQPTLFDPSDPEAYEAPPLGLLQKPVAMQRPQMSQMALEENARMLETVLEDYGVRGEITAVKAGPVVTLYELEPAPGLKASRVIGLADDIARSMSALSARVSTVPGRSVIGIELPNAEREKVYLREILETPQYGDGRVALSLVLGKDIEGGPVIANLAKMPHLLIAGTTGSGKSVAINTMILSLLYKLSPQQCRLIMIDPKMLELSVYDNIPHLLAPVVTDPKKAIVALKWVVAEMEERYRKMSKMGVRNIDGYNARVRDALEKGEEFSRTIQTGFDETTGEPVYETEFFEPEEMPFIVVIVDEMADLMMVAGKEIEACIQRLAQMARASGIHLIMATQRPSVDVITGTIKANFPTRISFQVTSKIDSRTILGEQGAEQLLGQGDMLYMAGGGRIRRVHGPFVSDEEVEEVVSHLKALGQPAYLSEVTEGADDDVQSVVDEKLGLAQPGDSDDQLYDRAVAIVARDRKCSTSYIQRKLAIGYNKAARLVEMMETQGVVSPANAVGKREIMIEER